MINPQNRDITVRLYRWMEQREYPHQMTDDEAVEYFKAAWLEINEILHACPESEWAADLAYGYYQALENRYIHTQKTGGEKHGT